MSNYFLLIHILTSSYLNIFSKNSNSATTLKLAQVERRNNIFRHSRKIIHQDRNSIEFNYNYKSNIILVL